MCEKFKVPEHEDIKIYGLFGFIIIIIIKGTKFERVEKYTKQKNDKQT